MRNSCVGTIREGGKLRGAVFRFGSERLALQLLASASGSALNVSASPGCLMKEGGAVIRLSQLKKIQPARRLELQLEAAGLSFVKEFRFHATRNWRTDFALPALSPRLLVECEGGSFIGGRHTTGAGYERDIEKYNIAILLGYVLIRCTPKHIDDGLALAWIQRALDKSSPRT